MGPLVLRLKQFSPSGMKTKGLPTDAVFRRVYVAPAKKLAVRRQARRK
jgi:hypothetical protein